MLDVQLIPAFESNYIFLATDPVTGVRAVIDPGDAVPVEDALGATGGRLDLILLTHHHHDHTGGTDRLRALTGAKVVGNAADAARLPALDVAVNPGDSVMIGEREAIVLDTPGHTVGHIAYHVTPGEGGTDQLFCGDTLFVMGCGRLFEGTARQMWVSLQRLAELPSDTIVYCAHEYSAANAAFAESLHLPIPAITDAIAGIRAAREAGLPTVPTTIWAEQQANPFLAAANPEVATAVGLLGATPEDVFAEIRRRKDAA